MTLFRPHRGGLAEAMSEVTEINTLDEMVAKIEKDLSAYRHNCIISRDTVHVEWYCNDKRINWDTYIVTLDNYGVIGFTNGQLA